MHWLNEELEIAAIEDVQAELKRAATKKRFSLAVIDGDKTVYLYKIEGGMEIDQEWPDDWPGVVSAAFLRRHCEQVVTA